MSDDLKARILGEIDKSGFPLEVSVARTLYERGWFVTPNVHHSDRHNDVREVDIVALSNLRSGQADGKLGNIGVVLAIECKKSREKPWVFFQQPWNDFSAISALIARHLISELRTNDESSLFHHVRPTELLSHHFSDASRPIARTYFEAFKQHRGESDIFTAVTGLWRAHDFLARWLRTSGGLGQPARTALIHDVIVFEGQLFSASLADDGKWIVTEQDHILLRTTDFVTFPEARLFPRNEVVIDVVGSTYLETYLDVCSADRDAVEAQIRAVEREGWLSTPAG